MIKVLIVDDEMMFRIGVKSCIDWNQYGYELVGEAGDGQQALDMVRKLKPDLIFTDIKMPVMDGLEFTRLLLEEYPETRVIILSCYNEFELVKEALKLGARDYIHKVALKPSDLVELLLRLKDLVEAEQQQKKERILLEHELMTNIHRMKTLFLKELVSANSFDSDLIKQKMQALNIRINYGHNGVLVFGIDRTLQFLEQHQAQPLNTVLINLAADLITEQYPGEVIEYEPNTYLAIVSLPSVQEPVKPALTGIYHKLNSSFKKILNCTISAGISGTCGNCSELPELFRQASEAFTGRFYAQPEYLGFYNPDQIYLTKPLSVPIEVEQQLEQALEAGDSVRAEKTIARIITDLNQTPEYHPAMVRNLFHEIIFMINRIGRIWEINPIALADGDPYQLAEKIDTLAEWQEYIRLILAKTILSVQVQKSKRYRNEVREVMDYVKENISRNVSLREAAKIANMSEKYFCQVFKRETGKNYIEFVTELKMDAARVLLADPCIKAYEVAQKLGFDNESYFSKTFKKYNGLAPQIFKKSLSSKPDASS